MEVKIMRICSVDGCGEKHYSKGYCKKHYHRLLNYGDVLKRTNNDPNEFIVEDSICWVILYNIKNIEVARSKFNLKYYEILKDYKWSKHRGGYVTTTWFDEFQHQHQMSLHSAIIELSGQIVPYGFEIDHKDRDKLNNLEDNLRICTRSQNQHNTHKRRDNTSGLKGVSYHKYTKKWAASIMNNNIQEHLGVFNTKEDAARAYNVAAIEYHGEFAQLNNI